MKDVKKPWVSTIIISILALFALASVAFAEYASTEVYFNAPTITTFTIRMPSSYSGSYEYPITATTQPTANATAWISFNASSLPANYLAPMTEGDSGKQQGNESTPIFWIENTGNVVMDLWMYWNVSLSNGWDVTANGTCGSDCSTVNDVNLTASTDAGAQLIVDDLSIGGYANVTLWANASSSASDLYWVKLYTKSNSTA